MNPEYELYSLNLSHAFNEIKQSGKNITGKTEPERRFQSLEQFADTEENHKKLFNKYLTRYEALIIKMGVEIVQDRLR